MGDTDIQSVSEKPVKSLGKLFTSNLKDAKVSVMTFTLGSLL